MLSAKTTAIRFADLEKCDGNACKFRKKLVMFRFADTDFCIIN